MKQTGESFAIVRVCILVTTFAVQQEWQLLTALQNLV